MLSRFSIEAARGQMTQKMICLQDRVHNALKRSPYLAQRGLITETAEGRVTIRGEVTSFFEKQMAQEAIRRVEGIEFIDNQLEVVGPLIGVDAL
jgi:osmotically-inducible protein OsmY